MSSRGSDFVGKAASRGLCFSCGACRAGGARQRACCSRRGRSRWLFDIVFSDWIDLSLKKEKSIVNCCGIGFLSKQVNGASLWKVPEGSAAYTKQYLPLLTKRRHRSCLLSLLAEWAVDGRNALMPQVTVRWFKAGSATPCTRELSWVLQKRTVTVGQLRARVSREMRHPASLVSTKMMCG